MRAKRQVFVEQMETSLATGRTDDCWRFARLLAARRLGPKSRRYGAFPETTPSLNEWSSFLQGPGPRGGCDASEVWRGNFDNLLYFWHATSVVGVHSEYAISQEDALELAASGWIALRDNMCKVRKGTAVPPWSCPQELWAVSVASIAKGG